MNQSSQVSTMPVRTLSLHALALSLLAFVIALMPRAASAVEIQRFTTPGGINVWLVEENTVPLITMNFAWRGGAAQDPGGKSGVASFLTTMMDEGAGDMNSTAYQEREEALAMRMSFSAGRDSFFGEFRTLVETRDEAFEMLRLAVNEPRFDDDAFARMREQILTGLRDSETDPQTILGRTWGDAVFGNHPYGRPVAGTVDTVSAISIDDLRTYRARNFARDNLFIGVVGAIDQKTLAGFVDKVFGGLPLSAQLAKIPDAIIPDKPFLRTAELDVPQTVIQFGRPGLLRDDPDFIPAYVLNYILGGGSFSSRLYEEVREKRGLAYSVYSYLYPLDHAALYVGGLATRAERAQEAIDIVREEIARMAKDGPTDEELASAKAYLKGSYALRFDTGDKIASQLVQLQLEDLGYDYFDKRNGMIEAVKMEDIRRAAKRLLDKGDVFVIAVGRPTIKTDG
ncbi:MAG: insulinase family protein [Rhodobiaceae bacterium]|nr:insulinase family protein [Rhodobiaceae bacterium]MCC0049011.1 insulinase family protein [Rhodobiaceae bacterium]